VIDERSAQHDEVSSLRRERVKVAVIGANGQLGSDICGLLIAQGISFVPLTRREIDVTDAAQVDRVLESAHADVVINTAAYHKVDQCEKDPALSFAVNAIGPKNVATTCRRIGSVLVHFSTDYVFDGRISREYAETDFPKPLSIYAASKLAGECLVPAYCERYFVLRTCGLYGLEGSRSRGGNFVETMLMKAAEKKPLRVVNDQVLTPTFTVDVAEIVSRIIRTDAYGLYHVTNEGGCSWYDFARKIFELEGIDVDLKPVTTAEYYTGVRRAPYSVLSKAKLNGLGLSMPHWTDALARYLTARRSRLPEKATVSRT
jgi:dTDP-4-dehydrorhamnose reductase